MLEEDTSAYGAYTGGGIATQVKEPKNVVFKTLAASMEVGPGKYCSPLHRMPYNATNEGSKRVSMTWRALGSWAGQILLASS